MTAALARTKQPLVLTKPAPPPLSNIEVGSGALLEMFHNPETRDIALALAEEFGRKRT